MQQEVRTFLRVCFLLFLCFVIFRSCKRLSDEETSISMEQVNGVSEMPSFTICPYFIGQEDDDEQANFTFADLMSDSMLSLFKSSPLEPRQSPTWALLGNR
jgi:hypothetical protein